ncbi:MAG: hypothetical protein JXR91_09920 [Deltaproteobacteria bacterium]|nr:hypothetical protein [Deltaproteobacteria bacterium]
MKYLTILIILLPVLISCEGIFSNESGNFETDSEGDFDSDFLSEDADSDGVLRKDDCNDGDPDVFQYALPDEDGDGYPLLNYPPSDRECVGDPLPPNMVLYSIPGEEDRPWDCDDNDPSVYFNLCVDQDGDGVCAPFGNETLLCGNENIPAGYAFIAFPRWYNTDCDDLDAATQVSFYRDDDSDGENSTIASMCVSIADQENPSEGYFKNIGRDCNDADPKIASFVPDVQQDGMDANCDGVDDQYLCSDGTYDCQKQDEYSVCTGGADLVPVFGQAVSGCGESENYFLLGNHGDNTYVGRVRVTYLVSIPEI